LENPEANAMGNRTRIQNLASRISAVALGLALAMGVAVPVVAQNLIQGQIMSNVSRQMIVRVVTNAGTVHDEVYSSPDGRFVFQNISLDPQQFYFLLIEEEGFKPYRERLDYRTGGRRDNRLFVYLEAEDVPVTEGGARVVDLSQLVLDGEARGAYEDAMSALDAGRQAEAAEYLERVVERAPDFFEARDELGALYVTLGRFGEAEETLTIARELNPSASRPLLNLGTMHYKMGETHFAGQRFDAAQAEYIEAANTLEQVIRMDPQAGMAYQNMGAALYRLQELSAAEALLIRGLEIDPQLHESRLLLVNVYNRMGRFDNALDQLESYLDLNPNSGQREALVRMRANLENARDAQTDESQQDPE
jgi:tetratricopeptide (TPR) repeat protein